MVGKNNSKTRKVIPHINVGESGTPTTSGLKNENSQNFLNCFLSSGRRLEAKNFSLSSRSSSPRARGKKKFFDAKKKNFQEKLLLNEAKIQPISDSAIQILVPGSLCLARIPSHQGQFYTPYFWPAIVVQIVVKNFFFFFIYRFFTLL